MPPDTNIPTPRTIDYELQLDGGKYIYRRFKEGGQEALRYNEPWRNLTGDNLIYFMAYRVEELERENIQLREEAKKWESLYDALQEPLLFEINRDSIGETETYPECLKRKLQQLSAFKQVCGELKTMLWDRHNPHEPNANCKVCQTITRAEALMKGEK